MNSHKLLRNLLDAALAADLEKNELRLFLALLKQTLGYGKAADPLTMGRLSQLTGIRKDRIAKAVSGVMDKGVFERSAHSWLDFTYRIPEVFFEGEVEARFFAPTVPLNGELTQPTGQETHSAGAYRDTPLQSINPDKTNKAEPCPVQADEAAETAVCFVDQTNDAVEQSNTPAKPAEIEAQVYQKLLPALKTLPREQADGVLQLLALSIREGSIRTTPERMGGGLIKAARQGTLDTSRLKTCPVSHQSPQESPQAKAKRQAREKAQERAHLERLARMADVPLETLLGGAR